MGIWLGTEAPKYVGYERLLSLSNVDLAWHCTAVTILPYCNTPAKCIRYRTRQSQHATAKEIPQHLSCAEMTTHAADVHTKLCCLRMLQPCIRRPKGAALNLRPCSHA